jgi:hypothetical protein
MIGIVSRLPGELSQDGRAPNVGVLIKIGDGHGQSMKSWKNISTSMATVAFGNL